jgi:hypothetical protein
MKTIPSFFSFEIWAQKVDSQKEGENIVVLERQK